LEAQQNDGLAATWSAGDCVVPEEDKARKKTRVYTGCDGVMVPIITEAEKIKRRDKIKAKRRRSGKKCKPLPPRKRGADRSWKEFKVVYFYSEGAKHQHVAFTHGNHVKAGMLLRREADRLRFREADDLMHVFKHAGYATAWEKSVQWRAALHGTAKREAADRLINFVSQRQEMIRYPTFHQRGWQIGSGPT
jgi:hypothetical protein